MAPSINWLTKVVTVPQSDLLFISGTLYELDTDTFRMQLKSIEDSSEGMAYERICKHNTEVTILGTTFARVIEIVNGYSITFEDGAYTVKLVGSNNNFFDVEGGILNRNQVQVVSTNSAGLIASAADRQITEDVNYADGIFLDMSSTRTGTTYPTGTRTYPVSNLADALLLSTIRAQSTIQLAGTLTLTQDVSGKEFISWKNGKVDLNNQVCVATRFVNLKVYGTQASLALFYNCRVANLQELLGIYQDCRFIDDTALTLQSGQTTLIDCSSSIVGGHVITFDCAAAGIELEFRNISSGVMLTNFNDATDLAELGFNNGMLTIDSTCTAGNIYVGGICGFTDNSAAGCTVNTDGLSNPETIANAVLDEVA